MIDSNVSPESSIVSLVCWVGIPVYLLVIVSFNYES